MELRYYQEEAKQAFYAYLREREDNPCVVIPTGGGKTPVLASICHDAVKLWDGRVLVLAHVKELIEQTADKLNKMATGVRYGIYSAGLGRKEYRAPVVVAGIQSVYKKAADLGSFDLILVDEAHMIPLSGDGMYRQFLNDSKTLNPDVRVGGFTATPYRLGSGPICTPEGILNEVCYEIGVKELIAKGYLSKLTNKAAIAKTDVSGVAVRGGEYVSDELEAAFNQVEIVRAACREIVEKTGDRKAVLVFTAGVDHGFSVCNALAGEHGQTVEFITGETPNDVRDRTLAAFKRGSFKYLVNVNVLTTGFDAPNIDCVAIVRSTLSPGLFYQMVGRGFRLHPGKADCLVLDFGDNVVRHGPVDKIKIGKPKQGGKGSAPAGKECPECQEVVPIGVAVCTCGYEFQSEPREPRHNARASKEAVLSGEKTKETHVVQKVYYSVHRKRGDREGKQPRSMRVDYQISLAEHISEWICVEHQGFARNKAVGWWVRHSPITNVPTSAEEAVSLAKRGALAKPLEITIERTSGEDFPRIVSIKLGEIPKLADIITPEELAQRERLEQQQYDDPFADPQQESTSDENWLTAAQEAWSESELDFPFGANEPAFDDGEIPF